MANELVARLKAYASAHAKNTVVEVLDHRQFRAVFGHIGSNLNGNELSDKEADNLIAAFYRLKNEGQHLPIRMKQGVPKDEADKHPIGSPGEIVGRILEMSKGKDLKGKDAVLFIGEVYSENEASRQAWNLIKNKQFKFGSWELDYSHGKCSQCGKEFNSENNICEHMTTVRLPNGSRVVVSRGKATIQMQNVTPAGWSSMESPGADQEAIVMEAAAARLINNDTKEAEMAEKNQGQEGLTAVAAKASDLDTLKAENEALKAENSELKAAKETAENKLAEYQKQEKAAKVESIIAAKEARGVSYDAKAREKYAGELMEKTDESLNEIKATIEEIPVKAEATEEPPAPDPKAQAAVASKLSTVPQPKSMGDGGDAQPETEDEKILKSYLNQCKEA